MRPFYSYNAHTTATDVLWGGVPVVRSSRSLHSKKNAFNAAVARRLTLALRSHFPEKTCNLGWQLGLRGGNAPFIPSFLRVLLHRANSVVFHHNALQVWPPSTGDDRQELERLRCVDRRDGQSAWDAEGIPAVRSLVLSIRKIKTFQLCRRRPCVMVCLQVLGADAACPVAVVRHQGLGR